MNFIIGINSKGGEDSRKTPGLLSLGRAELLSQGQSAAPLSKNNVHSTHLIEDE